MHVDTTRLGDPGMFEFMCIGAVERPLVVRWIVGSIPHGGPFKLFLVAASAQRLV